MQRCADESVGRLLHAYEIGILDEQECEQFEVHLLECEYCSNLLDGFERHCSLLMSSPRAKAIVDQAAANTIETESAVRRIWGYLWPKTPLVLRPAVAYMLVLALAVPAYLGLGPLTTPPVSELQQTAHLSPTRAAAGVFRKSVSGYVLLTFDFNGYVPGRAYRIVIESDDGTVAYVNDQFRSFDERETGSLMLSLSELKTERYRLIISDPKSESSLAIQEYLFSIEE